MQQISTFDDAMLAYLERYYAGDDPQAGYYHSMTDPRGTLYWHKSFIIKHSDEIAFDFSDDEELLGVGHGGWFFTDGSTPEQLTAKALSFVDGFYKFLVSECRQAKNL